MLKQSLPFKKHIFVCVNQREEGVCCGPRGGNEIREQLKRYVKDQGLQRIVRVSRSGCMDQCAKGPNVMVFPDNIWFQGVIPADIPAIIQECLACIEQEQSFKKL